MTEKEKVLYAKSYIDFLANGVNPVTKEPIPDDDVINNVRISRCLFYVSEVLEKYSEKMEEHSPKELKNRKGYLVLSQEEINNIPLTNGHISLSEIRNELDKIAVKRNVRVPSFKIIQGWMEHKGYLTQVYDSEKGRMKYVPTQKGNSIGIRLSKRNSYGKEYTIVEYSPEAQYIIYSNVSTMKNQSLSESE